MNSDEAALRSGMSNPIDLVYLARQSGGDSALEAELLALFADQCVRHLATIAEAGRNSGSEAAHTLKGAARAIGAWNVADAAERVEKALEGTMPGPAIAELASAADEARKAIAAMRAA
jgi:HPt (histidine-containing phosphotransfer) domain-containing protein